MESSGYIVLLILVNVAIWVALSAIPRLKNKNRIFFVLSFVSIWVLLSFREPYSDMVTYTNYFRTLEVGNIESVFKGGWEILFNFLLFIIRFFTDDVQMMIRIVSFITLIGPFLFIRRYSKNYLLSVVMFVAIGSFYMDFFILRQAIAISIFLIFIRFIGEKKLFKYCIGIAIATMFHQTALILLLLYPFVNIPPSKYKNIAITIVSVLFLIFSPQISNILVSDFYSYYVDSAVFGEGIKLFVLYIVMYAFYFLIARKGGSKMDDTIIKSSWLTMFLQFFAIQNNCFCRLANYTRDSFCIMIPNSIQELRDKDRFLSSIIIIALCICFVLATDAFNGFSVMQ